MFDEIYKKLIKSVSVGNLIENDIIASVSDDSNGLAVDYFAGNFDSKVQNEVNYFGINQTNLAEQLSSQLETENRRYNRLITMQY